jgi:integrase
MSTSESKRTGRIRLEPGIYERRKADGSRVIELYVKVNGHPRRRVLPAGTSRAQARKARTNLMTERDERRSPLATREDPRLNEATTLAVAGMRRRTKLNGKGRMSERTVESHEQRLRDHVLPALGTRKLSTLTKRDVLRLIDELRAKGLSEWTCHHILTALRAVLRYAREHDLAVHDPFQGIPSERLPAQQAREDGRVLRADEVNLMLRQARGKRHIAALTLLADTGLRSSELCGLRWCDVSLGEGYVSVEGQLARRRKGDPARIVPTKSLAGVRAIPLTPRALERLEALYTHERQRGLGGDDDFVLTTRNGGPLDTHNLRRTVRNAAKAAGIGPVTPRILRRSIATAFAEATVPAHVAASLTGHSPAVYNAHYVKPHRDRMERENALKRLLSFGYGTE